MRAAEEKIKSLSEDKNSDIVTCNDKDILASDERIEELIKTIDLIEADIVSYLYILLLTMLQCFSLFL